jgi:hypothetical protein
MSVVLSQQEVPLGGEAIEVLFCDDKPYFAKHDRIKTRGKISFTMVS